MIRWSKKYFWNLVAQELSQIANYVSEIYQINPLKHDKGELISKFPNGRILNVIDERIKDNFLLINGNFNYSLNIQEELTQINKFSSRSTRVGLIVYNSYLRFLYQFFDLLNIRSGPLPQTFITMTDLHSLCKLCGFELVRSKSMGFFPFHLFGLGTLINRTMSNIPFIKSFGLVGIYFLRPIKAEATRPLLSIVVPARNEEGNIDNIISRVKKLEKYIPIELIFVEGNSTDNTYKKIQELAPKYTVGELPIGIFQQPGKGKADAVREGFRHAKGSVFTILDADLTVVPEQLPYFYEAYVSGQADFVNGSRLVYPMEGEAMRFLNKLGNVFFAKALSYVLVNRLGDSLCGTKLFSAKDYERFRVWREDFGDFDPFGDFELLFPACSMALGTLDVPIHYKDRTYGTTNINRFRDGFRLLKMTVIGFFRIRLGYLTKNQNRVLIQDGETFDQIHSRLRPNLHA